MKSPPNGTSHSCAGSSGADLAEVLAKLSSASVWWRQSGIMLQLKIPNHLLHPWGVGGMFSVRTSCCAAPDCLQITSAVKLKQRTDRRCLLPWSVLQIVLASVKIHCRFSEQNKSWGVFRFILDYCPHANCIKYPEQRQPSPFQKSVRSDLLTKHSPICITVPERRRY